MPTGLKFSAHSRSGNRSRDFSRVPTGLKVKHPFTSPSPELVTFRACLRVGIATNIAGTWGGATNVIESGTSTPVTVTVQDTAPPATNRFLRLRVTRP